MNSVAGPGLANLRGSFRNGQVFLQWDEAELPPGTRLHVYSAAGQITDGNLAGATCLARHLLPGSAHD